MKTTSWARTCAAVLGALWLASCAPAARSPSAPSALLVTAHAQAFRTDATGDSTDAARMYLDLVRAAAVAETDPWQVATLEASLDALATRRMPSLGPAAADASLARRLGMDLAARLEPVLAEARGPFARGLVARTLARTTVDPVRAETYRLASGCVTEALVIGPTSWTSITGVESPSPFENIDAGVAPSYETDDSFSTRAHPVVVRDRGCAIELSAETTRAGVRAVVFDVQVPRSETVGIAVRAHGAAVLRAGPAVVLKRPFDLGEGEAARFATVSSTPGTLRLVLQVGTAKDDDSVEIDVFGDDGLPLRASAPAIGSASNAHAVGARAIDAPAPTNDAERLLAAASSLAAGDPPTAEQLLWGVARRAGASPELALAYARAVESSADLSVAARAERERSAYERVLEAWPSSWEARIAHAVLAGVKRGHDDAGIEVLRDLDAGRRQLPRGSERSWPAVWLDTFDALQSGREGLYDRALAALNRQRDAPPSAFRAAAQDAAVPRVGSDLAATVCDVSKRPAKATTLACFDALRSAGERTASLRELGRLRALLGAPDRYLALELRDALGAGDRDTAMRAFARMLPAERTASARFILSDGATSNLDAQLLAAADTARDAPAALAPLLHASGDDPAAAFAGEAERLAAEDRARPFLPNAATAVLAHRERYDVSGTGLVHWVLFDVRRVNGTADVDENAQASMPDVWGRAASRALRRRILKTDGRVLEPEQTPNASQAHAELSQLEQGDVVEAVYEGYALPSDTGDIGIDSPDLLPERTAVHEASIELRVPARLRAALWSHPLLGKPTETRDGDMLLRSWHVTDAPVRRFEDGVPRAERGAGISFSTVRWEAVARALNEKIASMDENDPEVAEWAHAAVGAAKSGDVRAAIDAIVLAAGRDVREADAGVLSDYGGGVWEQTDTARASLSAHDGSRSWLIVRALRELSIASEVVVAENDPFSEDPSFPPHFGRFAHPLVVAHVPGAAPGPGADVWIDADVSGPPLAPGTISPELRGRLALKTDGAIGSLPPATGGDDARDEVDVRLALDPQGNARGTFAIVLRGKSSQELAEALFRIVGAERQRALRDVVLAWLPWANVEDVQLASTPGSWQVSLRAAVTVGGYAQLEGAKTWLLPGMETLHWSSPRARVSSLAATFASHAGRESALALGKAVQYHVHRRIELPAGVHVARIPGPLRLSSKLLEAARSVQVVGGGGGAAVEDEFVLTVTTGTITAGDYDAFATTAHAADDAFLASMRVTLP